MREAQGWAVTDSRETMRAHVMGEKLPLLFSNTLACMGDGRGLAAYARPKVNGWEQCGHKKAASPATGGFG